MFVFPAFDSNYKTRKRTFKCCQNCRVKRVKCQITSTDYESLGCVNCRKNKWTCSLAKQQAVQSQTPDQNQNQQIQIQSTIKNELGNIDEISQSHDIHQDINQNQIQTQTQTHNQNYIGSQIQDNLNSNNINNYNINNNNNTNNINSHTSNNSNILSNGQHHLPIPIESISENRTLVQNTSIHSDTITSAVDISSATVPMNGNSNTSNAAALTGNNTTIENGTATTNMKVSKRNSHVGSFPQQAVEFVPLPVYPKSKSMSEIKQSPNHTNTGNSHHSSISNGNDIANGEVFNRPQRINMKTITPQYLKQTFNFNVLGNDLGSNYQYLFHGHPKVIIAMSDDQTIWHESGVYVKTTKENQNTKEGVEGKSYKLKNFGSGTFKEFYIRNENVYNFLLLINAFTLESPAYPFESDEVRQLIELYFYKLNSIFPLVHENGFWDDYRNNKAQNVLIYVVVLAILRDKMAESILKKVFLRGTLHRHGQVMSDMSQQQFNEDLVSFMSELEYKIRQILLILPQLGDEDKFSRLVVSLVLSTHFNYDKLGCENSSHDLTDAINLATSIGIHMKRLLLNAEPLKVEYSSNLWWCCYIFDRFNGLVNARPVFIRQEDFNVDLPYNNINLLKMVQLARSLENMFFAIFQPFNNNNVIGTNNLNNNMVRYKMFDTDEFQRIEFELCDKERSRNRVAYDSMYPVASRVGDNPFTDYVGNTIHFMTRVVNNVIILASQKAKYDNPQIPNHIPEAVALRASLNILWYLVQMKDEFVINIPMVPWCMSLAMAVALKKKARMCLKDGEYEEYKVYQDPFEFKDYINELEKFSLTWWVVDEICRLTRDFTNTLDSKSKSRKRRQRAKAASAAGTSKKKQKMELRSDWVKLALPQPVSSPVPKSDAIPSIRNMLQPPSQTLTELNAYVASTNGTTPYMQTDSSFSPNLMNLSDANQYDQYFELMQIDIFNNDFFKDVPNVINLLK